jgi:hypothetical protein
MASHYYLKIPNFLDFFISLFKNLDNFFSFRLIMPILPNVFSCFMVAVKYRHRLFLSYGYVSGFGFYEFGSGYGFGSGFSEF